MKINDLTDGSFKKIEPKIILNSFLEIDNDSDICLSGATECILIDTNQKYDGILYDIMYFKFEDSSCNCLVLGNFNNGVL
ncbi:MAG: hypothetical protein ACRCVV_06245 [Shewanella sp.]